MLLILNVQSLSHSSLITHRVCVLHLELQNGFFQYVYERRERNRCMVMEISELLVHLHHSFPDPSSAFDVPFTGKSMLSLWFGVNMQYCIASEFLLFLLTN